MKCLSPNDTQHKEFSFMLNCSSRSKRKEPVFYRKILYNSWSQATSTRAKAPSVPIGSRSSSVREYLVDLCTADSFTLTKPVHKFLFISGMHRSTEKV